MDRLGIEEFRRLLEVDEGPAISIYLPLERQEMTFKGLRLQLRAHIDGAAQKLKDSEEYEATVYQPLLERLRAMGEEPDFFNQTGDGVAVFAAPGFFKVYFLPVAFENICVVGENFHTRPLLEHIAAPANYWVLAIGEKEVTFWEGSPTGVEQVEIAGLPKSMQEALLIEEEPTQTGMRSQTGGTQAYKGQSTRITRAMGGRLPSPIFHGQGGGKEERNAYLQAYFAQVSKGIGEYLGDARGPLILAAVDYCHPIFRQASKLNNLAPEGIVGNVHFWNDRQIYEAAYPIARRVLNERKEEALREWERAFGRGNAELDPVMVGRRIVEGRVHRLLLDEEAHRWGRFDRATGEIREAREDSDEEEQFLAVDIYDELAETVIQRGGEVIVLSHQEMPSQTGVAAILRGNGG